MFDVAVFGSLFLTLFVIMDPPGITPIFLALTAGRPARVQKRMAFQAVCVAGGVITVFGLLGHQILDYLHVSVPALMIAGGLLLLLIALDLLTGKTDEPKQTKDVNVALVPLGTKGDLGLLACGSNDSQRFNPTMSTDFLAHIGELIAAALAGD